VSPQLFTATHWHQNDRLTSDHIANNIYITSAFQKAYGVHIPPRWITDKADWDLLSLPTSKQKAALLPQETTVGHMVQEIAEMSSTQIWRDIRKIKGFASTTKTINPNVEANRLADHLTTRADQTTLPKNIITTLKE